MFNWTNSYNCFCIWEWDAVSPFALYWRNHGCLKANGVVIALEQFTAFLSCQLFKMSISFCNNIEIQVAKTFQYFDLPLLNTIMVGMNQKVNY